MAFQRAAWRSGLTYKQTCRTCNITLQYTDTALDFRPWFANGFVTCPRCGTPLRHSEEYATDAPKVVRPVATPRNDQPVDFDAPPARFCAGCGKPFGPEDCFCAVCGTKR